MLNIIFNLTNNEASALIFFHTVWMMDMVLNKLPSAKGSALAVACFVLAAKYDDDNCIDKHRVEQFMDLDHLLRAERRIWKIMDFNIMCPNIMFILRFMSWKSDRGDPFSRSLAKLILYIVMYNKEYSKFTPFNLVVSALVMAKFLQGQDPSNILRFGKLTMEEMHPIIHFLKCTIEYLDNTKLCSPMLTNFLFDGQCVINFLRQNLIKVNENDSTTSNG